MKIGRMISFFLMIIIFIATPAYASYWTLTPDGQLDTNIGDEVAFNIIFHSTETVYMTGWDLDLQFDDTELEPIWDVTIPGVVEGWKVDYNDFDANFGSLYLDNGLLFGDVFSVGAGALSGVKVLNPGDELLFATIYMEVIDDQAWDYQFDIALLSQIGTENGVIDYYNFYWQYEGDTGVSVGSPVPVPAAVWMLGSGLLGLGGLRRRNS